MAKTHSSNKMNFCIGEVSFKYFDGMEVMISKAMTSVLLNLVLGIFLSHWHMHCGTLTCDETAWNWHAYSPVIKSTVQVQARIEIV